MYQHIHNIDNGRKEHITRRNSNFDYQFYKIYRPSLKKRAKTFSFACTAFPKSNGKFFWRLDLDFKLLHKVTKVSLKCDIETRKITKRYSYPIKLSNTKH